MRNGCTVEAVKGQQGRWHLSFGEWENKRGEESKLSTACRSAVAPGFRRRNLTLVNCLDCEEVLVDIRNLGQPGRWDKVSGRCFLIHHCPHCQSANLTPTIKCSVGKEDWCWYLCEDCEETFGPVVYVRQRKTPQPRRLEVAR